MAEAVYIRAKKKESLFVSHLFFVALFVTCFFFANLLAFQQFEVRPSPVRLKSRPRPVPVVTVTVPAPAPAQPRITIIVDDVGQDLELLEQLPAGKFPLTISIIPAMRYSTESAAWAARNGLEVMVHLPMEPEEFPLKHPGPGALMTWMSPEQLTFRTQMLLAQIPQAKGVNNHMGSRFSRDDQAMATVLNVIAQKQMYFIDSRTSASSIAYDLAVLKGVPAAKRTLFLDDPWDPEPFEKRWQELIDTALKDGAAIGICHLRRETVRALGKLADQDFQDVEFTFASRNVGLDFEPQHRADIASR